MGFVHRPLQDGDVTTAKLAAAAVTAEKMGGGQSGGAPAYVCRAWARFGGGTPVINAAGNVGSITDNGVGDFTLNFTTAMPDEFFAVSASGKFDTGASNVDTPICGPFRGVGSAAAARVVSILRADTLSPYDCIEFNVAVFR